MTMDNMLLHADSQWIPFWLNLYEGYEMFETTKIPPYVSHENGRYVVYPPYTEQQMAQEEVSPLS